MLQQPFLDHDTLVFHDFGQIGQDTTGLMGHLDVAGMAEPNQRFQTARPDQGDFDLFPQGQVAQTRRDFPLDFHVGGVRQAKQRIDPAHFIDLDAVAGVGAEVPHCDDRLQVCVQVVFVGQLDDGFDDPEAVADDVVLFIGGNVVQCKRHATPCFNVFRPDHPAEGGQRPVFDQFLVVGGVQG